MSSAPRRRAGPAACQTPRGCPELAEAATDGYIAGLRDGGWSGSADKVRATIAASGAAKYSWFGPVMVGHVIRDDLGRRSYGRDTSAAAAARRLTGLVTLISEWAQACYG